MSTGARTVDQRSRWLFPTLRGYRREWLRADIVAGVTAGAVVIPQAMAYATIADLPVEIGLYTCMLPLLVYAALGGSRAMSMSTTSTIATLTATTLVSAGVAESADDARADLVTLTLLVGVILVIARIFKLGVLVENINEATLVGIKVGLGATVALGQVPKLLGVDVSVTGHGFLRTLTATIEAVPNTNPTTLALSAGAIVVLLVLRRIAPKVPAPLIVVAAGILLVAFTGIVGAGVDLIAPVPTGLPVPSLPSGGDALELLPGAFAIAIMAFLETASVARGIRAAGEPAIDSNTELMAVGVTNVIASFFHALPAAGGFSQSAVNQRAGAKTQLSSIVTAVLALLVALLLAPVLSNLPQAILASMVFVAVLGFIDIAGLARFWRVSRLEFWICVVTAAVGMAAGLLAAVAAGVLFTFGSVLHEINKPRFTTERDGPKLRVIAGGNLYTGNVFSTLRAIEAELDAAAGPPDHSGIEVLELNTAAVTLTSLTVLDALADFDRDLAGRGVRLEVTALGGEPLAMARRTSWWRALELDGRTGRP